MKALPFGFSAKLLFPVVLLLVSFTCLDSINSQTANENNNGNVHFSWNSSYWGNTFSAGYDYLFSKHFYTGLSLSTGYFQYDIDDESPGNIFVSNAPGINNIFSVDFKQIIDLRIGYLRKQKNGMLFFNKYEIGMSYIHLLFEDEYWDKYHSYDYNLWKGSKNISLYSLYLSANAVTFTPKNNSPLSFDLGGKLHFSTTGKQSLLYQNQSNGMTRVIEYVCTVSESIYWFFPEVYIKVNYKL